MNIIILRLIKIIVFLFSASIAAKMFVKQVRKKNPGAEILAPEIIAVSAIVGAVITEIISALILMVFK